MKVFPLSQGVQLGPGPRAFCAPPPEDDPPHTLLKLDPLPQFWFGSHTLHLNLSSVSLYSPLPQLWHSNAASCDAVQVVVCTLPCPAPHLLPFNTFVQGLHASLLVASL